MREQKRVASELDRRVPQRTVELAAAANEELRKEIARRLKQMAKETTATTSACRTLADAERAHILEVLRQADELVGGAHGAAPRLGLPRTTLVYKMRKLGIEARRWHRSRSVEPAGDRLAAVGSF